MSIADKTLSKPIRSGQDYIFQAETIPQDDELLSDEVLLGRTQNALELVIELDEDTDLAADETITIEYMHGADFDQAIEIYSAEGATTTGSTLDAGELARFVPPSKLVESPAKIKVTTTDGAIDGEVTVYANLISR